MLENVQLIQYRNKKGQNSQKISPLVWLTRRVPAIFSAPLHLLLANVAYWLRIGGLVSSFIYSYFIYFVICINFCIPIITRSKFESPHNRDSDGGNPRYHLIYICENICFVSISIIQKEIIIKIYFTHYNLKTTLLIVVRLNQVEKVRDA